MPNHVRNRLTIPDEAKAKEAFDLMRSDKSEFDFEQICPIPPHVYKGSINNTIAKIFGATSHKIGDIELVTVYDTGDTWLPWCIEHWGTKWNAYSIERIDSATIQFDTAWNGVPRIVLLLADRIEIEEFTYEWADEDFCSNTGLVIGRKSPYGTLININQPKNLSREAFEIAAKLHPGYLRSDKNPEGYYWDEERDCLRSSLDDENADG